MNNPTFQPLVLILASSFLVSCFGLSEKEEAKLNEYKLNAKNYHSQGKYEQAIDQCRKGLRIDDDDYSLNLELGMALFYYGSNLKDREQRIKYIFLARDRLDETDSMRGFFSEDDYKVHLCLGIVHYKIATEYKKQGESFRKRIEAGESSGVAEESLAKLREDWETCKEGSKVRLEEAKFHILKVLSYERQGDNLEAILYLGQIYAYSKEYEKTIEQFEQGLDLLDKSVAFLARRLENKETMDSQDVDFYTKRLTLNKDREKELRGILASIYGRLGKNGDRLAQYKILEEKGFLDGAMVYNKALAEEELGLYPEAIIDYNTFIRQGLAPDTVLEDSDRFHKAIDNMMTMLRKIDNSDTIQRFLTANPEKKKNLHWALADLYYSVGMYEKCITEYDTLEAEGLMDGNFYFNRALAEQEFGRYEEAILDYDRFLKRGGIPGLHLNTDERFLTATRNAQKCRALLEGGE